MSTVYSVQQIKFELISTVKEFGADFSQWSVGTATDAERALFAIHAVDRGTDIWIWKPALTPAAARMIQAWMVDRQKAKPVAGDEAGPCVFMFRKV